MRGARSRTVLAEVGTSLAWVGRGRRRALTPAVRAQKRREDKVIEKAAERLRVAYERMAVYQKTGQRFMNTRAERKIADVLRAVLQDRRNPLTPDVEKRAFMRFVAAECRRAQGGAKTEHFAPP